MPKVKQRYFLRNKDVKLLLNKMKSMYPKIYEQIMMANDAKIEYLSINDIGVYVLDNKPILIQMGDDMLYPTINILNKIGECLPKIIVDQGAIPYIINGADVMAPGITEVIGDFKENSIVQIVEKSHNIVIAIGASIFSSEIIRNMQRGKVVKNIHHVNDKIWETLKQYFPNEYSK
jgi:PUA domain protein